MRFSVLFYCVVVIATGSSPLHCGAEDRTIDGSGNNLQNPQWGAGESNFIRVAPAGYDTRSNPVGSDLLEPRVLSNLLFDQNELFPNPGALSGYVYAFGQFISHDIQETLSGNSESINMQIPADDLFFDEGLFPLTRSQFDPTTGRGRSNPRQQINFTSAFIDASTVYGPNDARASILRGGPASPGAKLRTSDDINGDGENLLPRNAFGPSLESNFIAGDARVNDNVVLSSIHTVFMREHNRLIDELRFENPDWSDEQLFQRARKFVGAEIQAITFNEFLPALVGPMSPALQGEYDPEINPSVANEFATVFLRIGHSMLTPDFKRVHEDGRVENSVELQNAFFNPGFLDTSTELELLLKGLAVETQETVDLNLVDAMRFAFLGAIDLQRSRDHGLVGYNEMREAYGLDVAGSFADISADPDVVEKLAAAYEDVDSVEAFVGALAEDHLPDANVGALTTAVYVEQFARLRDGDRFWYSNDDAFTPADRAWIEATTLSDVIQRNTGLTSLQDNVFLADSTPALDCNGDGVVTLDDLSCANQTDSTAQLIAALGLIPGDLDGDGTVAFADFLSLSANFGKPVDTYGLGDIDDNGTTDFGDFLTLSANFGRTTISLQPVPEPDTRSSTLVFLPVLIVIAFRSRRP